MCRSLFPFFQSIMKKRRNLFKSKTKTLKISFIRYNQPWTVLKWANSSWYDLTSNCAIPYILLAQKTLTPSMKIRLYFGKRYLLNPWVYSNVSYIFGISTSRWRKIFFLIPDIFCSRHSTDLRKYSNSPSWCTDFKNVRNIIVSLGVQVQVLV